MVKRILNVIPSRGAKKNWKAGLALGRSKVGVSIPEKVDLRESWWSIENQGNTGSCVGQALANGVLRYYLVKSGKILKTQKMSVRFIWTASRETDVFTHRPTTFLEAEGTCLKAALDITRKYGCVPDSVLPFDSPTGYLGDPEEFFRIASDYRISNYYQINKRNPTEVKRWLATRGPIFTWLVVDDAFCRHKGAGLLRSGGGDAGGHAVCIVGYDGDKFIIRNSWGTLWGDKGYAYCSAEYLQGKFYELYGIKL